MTISAAVPFVIRRVHGVVRLREITSTREDSYGLLRLEAGRMVVQWSTARETSRVGQEIRVDRDLGPVHEVPVPLTGLSGCRVRWRLFPWPESFPGTWISRWPRRRWRRWRLRIG
jgi:hypothetical protein